MYLDPFHTSQDHIVTITPQQGSQFAKEISDDFNPLHDPENKRFCVPGDLLFALTLARLGLSQKMQFNYTGMVGKDVELNFPAQQSSEMSITDGADKCFLEVQSNGETTNDLALIEGFSKAYVAFSGHSFPHILVPLMQKNNVMINPARPMVMYESMAFEFDRLNIEAPSLELVNSSLEVTGKRGRVHLEFDIQSHGQRVGHGVKTMVLSGLREYDQTHVDGLIALYEESKASYAA